DECQGQKNLSHLPRCTRSVDKLSEGCRLPGLIDRKSFVPPWFNETLYKTGQKFARDNRFLISFCHYIGAVLVACGDQAGQIILGTGKSHVRERAIPRYIATDRQVWLWYENNLKEDSIASLSMENVRAIHRSVETGYGNTSKGNGSIFREINKVNEPLWKAMEMDLKHSGIPQEYRRYSDNLIANCKDTRITMNQFSLAIAQYLFVAIPLITKDVFSVISPSQDQIQGWSHLWAVLGYAFGIEDEFNVALQPLEDIMEYYLEFFRKIILPGLFSLQIESKILVEVLLNIIDTTTEDGRDSSPHLTMTIILQDVVGIATSNLESLLSIGDKLRLLGWSVFKTFLKYAPQFVTDKINSDLKEKTHRLGKSWFKSVVDSDYLIAKYVYY
ncbi:unnamed protein product, partial [Allacma fusca]